MTARGPLNCESAARGGSATVGAGRALLGDRLLPVMRQRQEPRPRGSFCAEDVCGRSERNRGIRSAARMRDHARGGEAGREGLAFIEIG